MKKKAAGKRQLAVFITFIIMGINCISVESMVTAAQAGLPSRRTADEGDAGGGNESGTVSGNEYNPGERRDPGSQGGGMSGNDSVSGNEGDTVSGNEYNPGREPSEEIPEPDTEEDGLPQDGGTGENAETGNAGIVSLWIPHKVAIVIDPWEIGGRGQIYSERYTIRNVGETAGILSFTNLMEVSPEQGGILVRTDKDGLHRGQEKAVYLEMVFGNGEKVAFAREESAYAVRLEPGEELMFWFAGEVNENASGQWRDGDILLKMRYDWSMEEIMISDDEGQDGGEAVTENDMAVEN